MDFDMDFQAATINVSFWCNAATYEDNALAEQSLRKVLDAIRSTLPRSFSSSVFNNRKKQYKLFTRLGIMKSLLTDSRFRNVQH